MYLAASRQILPGGKTHNQLKEMNLEGERNIFVATKDI